MKKIFMLLIMAICLIKLYAQENESAAAAHLFIVDKAEVVCCGKTFKNTTKKIHVISNAGSGVYAITGIIIKDAAGNIVAAYSPITADYYSPCISLSDGVLYSISFIDAAGNVRQKDDESQHTYNIIAPACRNLQTDPSPVLKDSLKLQVNPGGLENQCVPQTSLNINTGIDNNGALIANGTADPFWGGFAIANLTGVYTPWNSIAGTKILSPTTSNSVVGIKTFKRNFYVCNTASISFSGKYRDDNMVVSFVIKDAGGTVKWSLSPLPTFDPQAYNDYPFSGSVTLSPGNYYFEFSYNNYEAGFGGFALSGTVTANERVLSNFPKCCPPACECGKWTGFSYNLTDGRIMKEQVTTIAKDRYPSKTIECSKTIIIKKGNTVRLNPLYTCSNGCSPKYSASVFMPNGSVRTITSFPYLFKETTPGYYTIKVTPRCGENLCPPCIIRIFVTPGCNGDVIDTDPKEIEKFNAVMAGEGRG